MEVFQPYAVIILGLWGRGFCSLYLKSQGHPSGGVTMSHADAITPVLLPHCLHMQMCPFKPPLPHLRVTLTTGAKPLKMPKQLFSFFYFHFFIFNIYLSKQIQGLPAGVSLGHTPHPSIWHSTDKYNSCLLQEEDKQSFRSNSLSSVYSYLIKIYNA